MCMQRLSHEKQAGSALVLSLIAALLLMIVSFEVAHTTRIEAFIAHNVEVDAKLDVACRAGLERALARLREDRQKTEVDSTYDSWYQLYVDTELVEADVADDEFLYSGGRESYGGGDEVEELKIYVETFDEAAKFNVYNLLVDEPGMRRERRDLLANVIDYYRNDDHDDLSFSDGVEIAKEINTFLRRNEETPYQGEANSAVVKPPTKQRQTLTDVAELLYVKGIHPEIMWDRVDEEGENIIPGLWRYLTIWSDLQININTADIAGLAGLFSPPEAFLAERIIEFRSEHDDGKDRIDDRYSETRSLSGEDNSEADPTGGAAFTQINELREKVEGINQETYNKISGFLTVQSSCFTVIVTAEKGHIRRSKLWVVRRGPDGFRILLEKPVTFPYYLPEKDLQDAEDRTIEENN